MTRDVRAIGYRHMLGVILVVYVLIIVVTTPAVGGPLRVGALGYLLYEALRTRRLSSKWVWLAIALGVALLLASIIGIVVGSDQVSICIVSASTFILVAGTMALIIRGLLTAGVVDGPAVRGVLCVYLLFALLFASMDQFAGALIPNFLHGVSGRPNASDTLYFSVITLATVGYGDITPASNVARAMAVAEALIGQLYLVSIVAAVVSRYQREGT